MNSGLIKKRLCLKKALNFINWLELQDYGILTENNSSIIVLLKVLFVCSVSQYPLSNKLYPKILSYKT